MKEVELDVIVSCRVGLWELDSCIEAQLVTEAKIDADTEVLEPDVNEALVTLDNDAKVELDASSWEAERLEGISKIEEVENTAEQSVSDN